MNYIFIVLFIIVFYWIFKQKKRADRELFNKQITDSLFLGVIEYCKFQLSDLGFWVDNKDNPNNKDQINEIKQRFFDLTLGEIYFYKRIIDSFESYLSEEEWNKFLVKSGQDFDIFTDKPSLINAKLYICDEPLRDLYQTVIL